MKEEEVATLVGIAAEAAELVFRIYQTPFEVDYKGPRDPVTLADREANALICERLQTAFPGVPVVAEESTPDTFAGYQSSERIFFVDPVDGTREFVAKNGEFVVMIGVVEGERATASVIHAPATGTAWVGLEGHGAFRLSPGEGRTKIAVSECNELAQVRVVASRSHRTPTFERALNELGVGTVLQQGSAGLKGARVAEASADAYVAPFYAGQRWDICACDALVHAAGGRVTDAYGAPIDYRAPTLAQETGVVVSNGLVHEALLERLALFRARIGR
ncbi:MAG TPA: inositol monophosphatase family protein [Polyangiaceae bacterium]|nr:inositol monophosphatase family protein [Polyangiaceae bacterium]